MPASIETYKSYNNLARAEQESIDYTRSVTRRNSPVAIFAPHGGGIEPGTSEIATQLAGKEFSLYIFECIRSFGCEKLHLPSTNFDEPLACALLQQIQTVVAIHGCVGRKEVVYVGGLHEKLRARTTQTLAQAGFFAVEDHTSHAGLDRRNICNLGQGGEGLQIEISYALRRKMFARLSRTGRATLRPPFFRFVDAVRKVLLEFPCYT